MKSSRWSDEETATLIRMRSEGATDPQIAEAIGRTIKSVECRWQYMGLSEKGRERRRQGERRRAAGRRKREYPDAPRLQLERTLAIHKPAPELLAERDYRLSLTPRDLTAAFCGDPLPGYSALERRA